MQQQPTQSPIHIHYATQTGTSFQLSIHLHHHLHYVLNFRPIPITPISTTLTQTLQSSTHTSQQTPPLHIFFISTTGKGDPPYHMRSFWRQLMSKSYPRLDGVRFGVYGLGDRGYGENFNMCARKFRQRLLGLGADQVVGVGLGDQLQYNGCYQQYFKVFLPQLCQYLINTYPSHIQPPKLAQSVPQPVPPPPPPSTSIPTLKQLIHQKLQSQSNSSSDPLLQFEILERKLVSHVEKQNRDVYWVRVRVVDVEVGVGDVLEIYPVNSEDSVQEMLQYLKKTDSTTVTALLPQLTQYLTQHANISNPLNFTFLSPHPSPLHHLISPQTDPQIRSLFQQKLLELGTDYNQYHNYIKKYRRNVREVIVDFDLRVGVGELVGRLGGVIGRKYSVGRVQGGGGGGCVVGLLVKLEKYAISSNREIQGLCSHDLCLTKQKEQKKIIRKGRILRNGQFSLPNLLNKNIPSQNIKILMISLGTGIAPFLSILWHALSDTLNNYTLTLFHSSRYKHELPFPTQLLQPLVASQKLTLRTTFTREPRPSNQTPKRLQVLVKQQRELVEKYSGSNCKVMICGTKEFCEVVCRIFGEEYGWDVKGMRKGKVLCMENW